MSYYVSMLLYMFMLSGMMEHRESLTQQQWKLKTHLYWVHKVKEVGQIQAYVLLELTALPCT